MRLGENHLGPHPRGKRDSGRASSDQIDRLLHFLAILLPVKALDPVAEQLRFGRESARLTQVVAAGRLGLSQPYLSQLESGRRRLPPKVARRAARLYGLSPTTLPFPSETRRTSSDALPRQLAALGYPGYQHLAPASPSNPAAVVLEAVSADELDARVAAAVPWVLMRYPDLDWTWLVSKAKLRNAQNRLGYLASVASELLDRQRERAGDPSRLRAALGELGRESMTEAERKWLRANRPAAAGHWNVLTTLSAGTVAESERPSPLPG
jgi:transcriptional regulator with XRE-family HTH domain